MKNSKPEFNISTKILTIVCTFVLNIGMFTAYAQAPESCDCMVDTVGYANFLPTLNPNENANFQLHPHGNFAIAYGVIGSSTPSVVQSLIDNNPEVTTIIMYACPGSEDDDANLQAAQLIYNQGYKMYLPFNGWVASGATDMFLAGSIRMVEVTVDAVGVHSWSDGSSDATDFPVGHAYHQPYINYYMAIGFSQQEAEDFYYFTINAAPANGIHWMSQIELNEYKVRSCTYSATPTYSISQDGNTLNAEVTGATYQWLNCDNGNAPINGETGQTFTPTTNGNYAVKVTESTCSGTSNCVVFTPSGIRGLNQLGFNIYPNPSNGIVTVLFENEHQEHTIDVFNVFGQNIKSVLAGVATTKQPIDLSNQHDGVYYLTINKTSTRKVLLIK